MGLIYSLSELDKFTMLCLEKGVAPTRVCEDIGITRSPIEIQANTAGVWLVSTKIYPRL